MDRLIAKVGSKPIHVVGYSTGAPLALDFLVLTDHAEFIGLAPMIHNSDPALLADPWGNSVHERFNAGPEGRAEAFGNIIEWGTVKMKNPFSSNNAPRSIWIDAVKKVGTYNESGHFTAMTGVEWTSSPEGDNLYRCVIYADGAEKTRRRRGGCASTKPCSTSSCRTCRSAVSARVEWASITASGGSTASATPGGWRNPAFHHQRRNRTWQRRSIPASSSDTSYRVQSNASLLQVPRIPGHLAIATLAS